MRISDWSSDVCSSDLVASIDLSATLFGRKLALPVALGPVGIGGMYARRGELQAARAAGAAGIPTCLSTVSICSIEEVARAADPFWFQLYGIGRAPVSAPVTNAHLVCRLLLAKHINTND